jgi:aspartyl-tRNA(Asn)/glutamyl-tRNA(Gln) amidotransferase subunit A
LANSVACCAIVDAIMAGAKPLLPQVRPLNLARFALPKAPFLDGMDGVVAKAFEAALEKLSASGARIVEIALPPIDEILSVRRMIAMEAYALHRARLESQYDAFDPFVSMRLADGASMTAADFISLRQYREQVIERCATLTVGYDAMLMPTVAVVPPNIAGLAEKAAYLEHSARSTRLTSVANCLDRCAVSIPCTQPGNLPVGFSLVGDHGGDQALLATALAVEAALA